jgi:hypothetical protein
MTPEKPKGLKSTTNNPLLSHAANSPSDMDTDAGAEAKANINDVIAVPENTTPVTGAEEMDFHLLEDDFGGDWSTQI